MLASQCKEYLRRVINKFLQKESFAGEKFFNKEHGEST